MNETHLSETWPELLNALTHELRIDVSAVLHQVELLAAADLDPATRQRSLGAIGANAEALVRFADDLTELGRLARGEVRPACRPVDVLELLAMSDNGDRGFTLDSSAADLDADTMVFTDPLIADHIVGCIIGEYRSAGLTSDEVVAAVAPSDQFVDVVLRSTSAPPEPTSSGEYRRITPEDGLALFVAHTSADLVGAGLDVLGLSSSSVYRLRLPSLRPAGGAVSDAATTGTWWWQFLASSSDQRTVNRLGTVREVTASVRTLASLDERSRRLPLLADADASLLRGSDPEALLPRLIDELSKTVGFEIYERFDCDADGTLRVVSGNAPWIADEATGTSTFASRICADATRRREPVLEHDLATGQRGAGDAAVAAYGCFPLLAGGEVVGALSFATTGPTQFDHDATELIQTVVGYIAVAVQRLRAEAGLKELNRALESRVRDATAELRENESQLRQLASDLVRAEQSERQRIAHMLHDDVQQLLFGAQMRLGLLREDITEGRSGDLVGHLDETDRYVADSIDRTRHLSAELAPVALDDDDLSESIEALVGQMRAMYGLNVVVEAGPPLVIADRAIRVVVHQTLRELLFNVVKHAGAAEVTLKLGRRGEEISVEVSDDGRGFDPEDVFSDPAHNRRGLATLRQRLRLVGGSLDLESIPGDGTRARVSLPAGSAGAP